MPGKGLEPEDRFAQPRRLRADVSNDNTKSPTYCTFTSQPCDQTRATSNERYDISNAANGGIKPVTSVIGSTPNRLECAQQLRTGTLHTGTLLLMRRGTGTLNRRQIAF